MSAGDERVESSARKEPAAQGSGASTANAPAPLTRGLGGVLVFLSSGAVLVLEILALRLVAPYVGITLQTSTAVIGSALAAIALGAWIGGRAADRIDPRRLLGPALVLSGITTLLVIPVVREAGELFRGQGAGSVLLLAIFSIFVPAALLTAVSPLVVKLQLASLARTGTVVGRYSGVGTVGAIVATFATGFVLVGAFSTSALLNALGIGLILLGLFTQAVTGSWTRRTTHETAVLALVGVLLLLPAILTAPQACQEETSYNCVRVEQDELRAGGRLLLANTGRQSFVDLDDPTYLRFEYAKVFAAVVDTVAARRPEPLSVLHIGGGGFTLPRYVRAVHPGSQNTVFEIDAGLIDIGRRRLGLETGPGLQVEAVDARIALQDQPDDTYDVVLGDAFGSGTPPWHLTTEEAVRDIDRVLTDDGVYAVNVIDYPPLKFFAAEAATLRRVFPHVVLVARPGAVAGEAGGNLVLVASRSPLPLTGIATRLAAAQAEMGVADGAALDRLVGDAAPLTDDFAPVDQLVTLPPPVIL